MSLSARLRLPLCLALSLALMPAAAVAQSAPAPSGFSWFANAAPNLPQDEAVKRAKAAIQKARALANGATWVCSPAGFGQKSRCYRG
ncbi:MAG: hypothetical protein R3D63_04465 [Paracoccaceae bacterium]